MAGGGEGTGEVGRVTDLDPNVGRNGVITQQQ